MAGPGLSERVFISYRRDDAQHVAGRIADHVAQRFGEANVFMDVDSIEPGMDFAAAIESAVVSCAVLVALIGQSWTTARDDQGMRRLDDPNDFVALEIAAALRRDVRLIPVLVDGAAMPRPQDLPSSIASLSRRNAFRLEHASFRVDVARLLDVLARVVAPPEPDQAGPVPQRPSNNEGSELVTPSSAVPPHSVVASTVARSWPAILEHGFRKMSAGNLTLTTDALRWIPGPFTAMTWRSPVTLGLEEASHDALTMRPQDVVRLSPHPFPGTAEIRTADGRAFRFVLENDSVRDELVAVAVAWINVVLGASPTASSTDLPAASPATNDAEVAVARRIAEAARLGGQTRR